MEIFFFANSTSPFQPMQYVASLRTTSKVYIVRIQGQIASVLCSMCVAIDF